MPSKQSRATTAAWDCQISISKGLFFHMHEARWCTLPMTFQPPSNTLFDRFQSAARGHIALDDVRLRRNFLWMRLASSLMRIARA